MLADYGAVESHLTPLFPECVPAAYKKPYNPDGNQGEDEDED